MRRYWCFAPVSRFSIKSVSMNPSLTETMTSRKGILLNEFVHVNFIVECKLSLK